MRRTTIACHVAAEMARQCTGKILLADLIYSPVWSGSS
jgi:hypothetical protein